MHAITQKLRKFRKEKGLTQQQISELLNMEQTTYSKIELGKSHLRFKTAIQIATIIEIDFAEFITEPRINNKVGENFINNNKINGSGFSNDEGNLPENIVSRIEELLTLFKQYFKTPPANK